MINREVLTFPPKDNGESNMSTRTQKAKWNISTSFIAQIIAMICGLIIPRLMIRSFGSELNGAATSIANFLAYISLIEGGIAGVARAALYKPLAEQDLNGISEVYNEIIRFFRIIGCIFIAYTLVLASSYSYIANNTELEWGFSFALVLVISISTLGQYFLGISNSILIQADQRQYINNILSIITVAINTLSIVILTRANCNIIIVKFASSIIYIIRPLALALYVKKHYKIDGKANRKTNRLSQKWTALGQHIAYFLHTNTDVVVLTLFVDLKTVSVYSVYNMIVTSIRNLAASFYNGIEAVFGSLYANHEYTKLNDIFGVYETLISFTSSVLFSTTAVLIIPFVKLYTIGVSDANYIIPSFGLIAVLGEFIYSLRIPYHNMVNAANRFRQTRFAAYGEAGINIILSITLVFKYGITGVALATFIAISFRSLFYAIYLSKHVLHRPIKFYIKRTIINGLSFTLIYAIGSIGLSRFVITNFYQWILCGVVVAIASILIEFLVNCLFYRKDIVEIMKRLIPNINILTRKG